MTLELRGIGIGDEHTPSLPVLDALLPDDAPAVAAIGGERGPMLASLVAAGRLAADRGEVLLDGRADPDAIRRAVALVDTPVVAEPAPTMPVLTIVREELRFAGLRSRRADAAAVLADLGLAQWHAAPIVDLPATDRIRLLLTLAAARPGVRHLVLTSPERHGGPNDAWLDVVRDFSLAGTPVLVLGGHAVDGLLLPTPVAAHRALGTPS